MGRRRQRASIGDTYVAQACAKLNGACLKEANLFLPRFTAEQITPMLFRDEDVAKLKAVRGLTAYATNAASYNSGEGMSLLLNFGNAMPAPNLHRLHWQEDRAGELRSALKAAEALVTKWGAVKWMLRWFNRNATIGAVRANWPCVMQLCPDSPAVRDAAGVPTRYTNPQGLGPLLPVVRATASTVATMAMLPESAEERPYNTVRLAFAARKVEVEGVKLQREELSLHL